VIFCNLLGLLSLMNITVGAGQVFVSLLPIIEVFCKENMELIHKLDIPNRYKRCRNIHSLGVYRNNTHSIPPRLY